MALKEIEIVQPAYFERFACLGPACTDNCCHDWVITIDKQHYLQYKAVQDPEFQRLCAKAIRRNKGEGDEKFAQMVLRPDERCVFQDEDGGCSIFRRLGPDALSHTCTSYPRIKNQFVPGVWEFSLSPSCEEAARLILLGENPMELHRQRRAADPLNPLDSMPENLNFRSNVPIEHLIPLREGCLSMLRIPGLPLRERILAVGLMLRRAAHLFDGQRTGQIPAMAAELLRQAETGVVGKVFEQMQYSPETHLWALTLPAQHLIHSGRGPIFRDLWAAVGHLCTSEDGRKYEFGAPALGRLLELAQSKADPLLSRFSQAVERYFINHVFSTPFPFTYISDHFPLEYHGVLLAEQYAMLRILLGVLAERENEPEEQRLVRAVVGLSRITQHTNLGSTAHHFAQEHNLDSLAYSAYLLR